MSRTAEMSQHTHTLSLEDTHLLVRGGHTALSLHQIARSAQFSSKGQQPTVSAKSTHNFLKSCDRQCFITVTAPLAGYEDTVITV